MELDWNTKIVGINFLKKLLIIDTSKFKLKKKKKIKSHRAAPDGRKKSRGPDTFFFSERQVKVEECCRGVFVEIFSNDFLPFFPEVNSLRFVALMPAE